MNDSMTQKLKTESLRYSTIKAAVGSSTFSAMRNITAALYAMPVYGRRRQELQVLCGSKVMISVSSMQFNFSA
jgi:hypothetical protein